MPNKPSLHVTLAKPRGFCAGVERAIDIVDLALDKYGAPVYVRHEIVHNKHVCDRLRGRGAIFVEELSEIPETTQPVIFSAHGVSPQVVNEAKQRGFQILDATCPLVTKVHMQARYHIRNDHDVVVIGHKGHVEVVGTLGNIPPERRYLVGNAAEAERLIVNTPDKLAYVTQTTLSVDETAGIIDVLKRRFPDIQAPKKKDICYATTNRQSAVKAVAPRVEAFLVVGGLNSSNSNRLVDVAKDAGCTKAMLIPNPTELNPQWLAGLSKLGISSGASVPEHLVQTLLEQLRQHFTVTTEEHEAVAEDVTFNLPRVLVRKEVAELA